MFHIVFCLQRCWKLNKELFGKVLLYLKLNRTGKFLIIYFFEKTLLSGQIFLLQKGVVISQNFIHFVEKEVICRKKLVLKKEGFLLNRDCYFKGYLLRKGILTFQSVKNYYFKGGLLSKRK